MDVVEVARSYLNTPFHHQGRLPGVGLDCIGVVVCAAVACGLRADDVQAYPLRPNGMLRKIIADRLVRVKEAQPGDVLLMSFEGEPHHLAIFAGETLIHSHVTAKRCVEQAYTQWWKDRTVAVYRFPELIA